MASADTTAQTTSRTSISSTVTNNMSSTFGTHFGIGTASNSPSNLKVVTPKIQETQLGESIQFRTSILADFRELGQPDLVHISEYDKSSKQELGEYHYVTGINTSSIVQPYMYLQTIQIDDKKASNKHTKIGTYCSYNVFRKGDLRIRCEFPGSNSPLIQFVPSDTSKIAITLGSDENKHKNIWLETYVSSLMRSLMFTDSIDRQLPGMCKFNPIQSTKDSKEAIEILCSFLHRGVDVGCSDVYNRPSLVNNYLVDTLFEILKITELYDVAIESIQESMNINKINLNVLLVRILLLKKDFAKAIKSIHDSLLQVPRDGWMLNEQCLFLISQNRPDLALLPAIISVECLPSEFKVWKTLTLIYILKKDIKNALLALNSSPMYVNKRKDVFSALKPKNFEFSFPLEGKMSRVWKDCESYGCISGVGGIVDFSSNEEIKYVNKSRLQLYEETKLNLTFKESYDLLALMNKQCGWTELLKIRSEVFVMEDEYKEITRGESEENLNSIDGDESISLSRFKTKRLSEKWLDSLFLMFYSNLKNVLIYDNEKSKNLDYSALEHELIGEECFKIHFYTEAIEPLKRCLDQRFSIFAACRILNYYLEYKHEDKSFKVINDLRDDGFFEDAYILQIVYKTISWVARYYGEFPVLCIKVLKTMINDDTCDFEVLKSQLDYEIIQSEKDFKLKDAKLQKNMHHSLSVVAMVDRYVAWINQFL